MTNQQHWLTPPHDQVYKWWEEACKRPPSSFFEKLDYVAAKAAEFGWQERGASVPGELQAARDEELDACCEWVSQWCPVVGDSPPELGLRAARRPKPPSLAEEALAEIQVTEGAMYSADLGCDFTATRRALERLQELEG